MGRRRCFRLTLAVLAGVAVLVACTPEHTGPPEAAGSSPALPDGGASSASAPPPAARRRCAAPCRRRATVVGRFGRNAAPEASGLAASRRNPGLLYVLDDGPGTTSLLVIRSSDGRQVGRLRIAGLEGTDTESLAAGGCGPAGGSCLYIGDIGDNLRQRATVVVTRVREPKLGPAMPDEPLAAEHVELRYPNESFDAEALLADAGGTLGIITKSPGRSGRGAARLYLAPSFTNQVLTAAGRVRLPPPRSPLITLMLGNVVTGGEAVPGRVALRTYDTVYEFTAPDAGAPMANFPSWRVRELRAGSEPQGEAIAYGVNGCDLFTVSEGSPRLTALACK